MDKEKRNFPLQSRKAEGYALLWGVPSWIPRLQKWEVFEGPESLEIEKPVSLYLEHFDKTLPLANSKSGTLKIRKDERGLFFSATLGESQKAVKESIERGDLSESSIVFTPKDDSFDGRVRKVRKAILNEISLCAGGKGAHKTEVNLRTKEKHIDWGRLLWEF